MEKNKFTIGSPNWKYNIICAKKYFWIYKGISSKITSLTVTEFWATYQKDRSNSVNTECVIKYDSYLG